MRFKNNDIKLVVFGMTGVIVDFGCLAVLNSFTEFLGTRGISATKDQIKGPTGINKKEHLRLILDSQKGIYNENGLNELYADFKIFFKVSISYSSRNVNEVVMEMGLLLCFQVDIWL